MLFQTLFYYNSWFAIWVMWIETPYVDDCSRVQCNLLCPYSIRYSLFLYT